MALIMQVWQTDERERERMKKNVISEFQCNNSFTHKENTTLIYQ